MVDYEKAYKEALAKAREIHRNEDEKKFDIEWLFPELKESEDEKIRGAIIDHLKDNNLIEWAAWLEKQGNPADMVEPDEDDIGAEEKDIRKAFNRIYDEKQGEQRLADNKEKLDLLNFIRKETGCGLAEANNALLKLIKALKQHPFPIMDKPRKLKIEWEE